MPKERRRDTSPPTWDAWQQSFAGRAKNVPVSLKTSSDGGVRLQLNGYEIPDDFALVFAPERACAKWPLQGRLASGG